MCSDLETSLAKIRPQSEQEELSEKWNELSTYSLGKYVQSILIIGAGFFFVRFDCANY